MWNLPLLFLPRKSRYVRTEKQSGPCGPSCANRRVVVINVLSEMPVSSAYAGLTAFLPTTQEEVNARRAALFFGLDRTSPAARLEAPWLRQLQWSPLPRWKLLLPALRQAWATFKEEMRY